MRRSRLTGQTKPNDTAFGWYFAGKPMDRKSAGSSRIRLVRCVPETETCIHGQCPSPSPVREKVVCTCSNRSELHSAEKRSPSPNSSASSGFEPGMRCKSCGGFHALKREPSPQVEKLICSCSRCEIHIREARPRSPTSSTGSGQQNRKCNCERCRRVENRPTHPNETHPLTPSTSDTSVHEQNRKSPGRRFQPRKPQPSPLAERYCPIHSRPTTPATSATFNSMAVHAPLVVHHHCPQAMYCEEHPELCCASPVPKPNSTRAQSHQSNPQSRQSSHEKSTRHFKCTCGGTVSPEVVSPASGPLKPRTGAQYCTCASFMGRYFVDDSNWDYFGSDTASDSSVHATAGATAYGMAGGMMGGDREEIESHCPLYHRCHPRFERTNGWVCGRK
ncbi:unnamed protein product [Penicillium salamii]|uniref:Uncharacterized protein n=1 Tax=Penicillium salamii TaxID=1612424 RepID=A0A9W4JTI6_9EURO|nr:unnamed protein product [Penicillium salamii]